MSDPKGLHAYVTLVSNSDYAKGALALVRSLRLSGTGADIVVLHAEDVDKQMLAPLTELGAIAQPARQLPLSEAFVARHLKNVVHGRNPFTKGRKPAFHTPLDNFRKLRAWQLTAYRSFIFIDADALVLRNIDKLFSYPEFSAAPNVYESLGDFHRLNSGVFVARPSEATFAAMISMLDRPKSYWPRTDQTFLQQFFPDWHGLPVFMNMLQYVWFNLPQLWDWRSIGILHYQYEKPWEMPHPREEQLRVLIELWHAYYSGIAIPDVASLPNPPGRR